MKRKFVILILFISLFTLACVKRNVEEKLILPSNFSNKISNLKNWWEKEHTNIQLSNNGLISANSTTTSQETENDARGLWQLQFINGTPNWNLATSIVYNDSTI